MNWSFDPVLRHDSTEFLELTRPSHPCEVAGLPPTLAVLQAYAIGGSVGPNSPDQISTVAALGDTLVLTAIVRTDDPALTVVGEVAADLASFSFSNSVVNISGSGEGISQTGVPAGCERQEFRTGTARNSKLFIRLRIDWSP